DLSSLSLHDALPISFSPFTWTGSHEFEVITSQPRICVSGRCRWLVEPDDNRLGAAVQVKIAHGVAQRIIHIQPAELPIEVSETVDHDGLVRRSASHPSE